MPIEVNSLWKFSGKSGQEPGVYRLLGVFTAQNLFVIFNVEETNKIKRPKSIPMQEFKGLIRTKDIQETDIVSPPHLLIDQSKLSSKTRSILASRWELIEPLVDDLDLLLSMTGKKSHEKIIQRANETSKHTKAIYSFLNLYWRYGQSPLALLPRFDKCGGLGKQRTQVQNSLGRKVLSRTGAFPVRLSYIVTEEDKRNIVSVIKKYHLKPDGISIAQTYKNYLREYFPNQIKGIQNSEVSSLMPSERQFRSWVKKLIEQHELIRNTKHENDYDKNFRANETSVLEYGKVPGACYEIDATVIDVHLVAKWNRNYVIGRPTLYFIVDRASGLTVGLSVSLFHASWEAAQLALHNAFTSKVEYCARYGIEIQEKDWPCAHIPNRLVADNAEMLGLEAEAKVIPMVPLEWAPISRPDFKPYVEGRFTSLNKDALHRLKGATKNNGKIIKGAPDPRSRAIYTIEELTKIIILDVLDKNNEKQKSLAIQNKLLVEENLVPTPLNYWHVCVANYQSALKKVSAQEVEARLLKPVKLSVTKNGILYREMYYSHDKVRQLNLSAIARTDGRIELEGRVNDDILDFVYARLPGETTFTKCQLLKRSQEMSGLSFADVLFIQDWTDNMETNNPVSISSIETLAKKKAIERHAKNEAKKSPKLNTKKDKYRDQRQGKIMEIARSLSEHNSERGSENSIDEKLKSKSSRVFSFNVISLPTRGDRK